MTSTLSDHDKQMYTHMLTSRLRWARRVEKTWDDMCSEESGPDCAIAYEITCAADAEVRACIREIARACRFESACMNEITGPAWTASKE